MKIARILWQGKKCYAKVEEDKYYLIDGDIFDIKNVSAKPLEGSIKILAPTQPSKIVALGANYKKHAKELNLNINPVPLIFLKPPSSVIADGESIIIPPDAKKVDYEAELAIIIGKDCKNVKKEEVFDVICGYTCANDVSERIFQKSDGQWTRAKGFDTFCPVGPVVETELEGDNVSLKAVVNGNVVQQGNTSDMINDITTIITFISSVMTLKKGDLILTGTPEGVGQIRRGDTVEIIIEGIGVLKNEVI